MRRVLACLLVFFVPGLSAAQAPFEFTAGPARSLTPIDGPVAPGNGDTIARDAEGRATLRATRLVEPLRIDGRLDEEIYSLVPAAGGFVQQLPREGVPATEPTDIWVFFDDANVYVAARCRDSQPDRLVANELRRDHRNVFQLNDSLTVVFDTFYDRRNGFFFQTNPIGAVRDQAIKDGGQNESWNAVWDVKAVRDADGYTLEMVIPFKSLRYRSAGPQVWGFNVRRIVKWKNEVSNLTPVPASYSAAGVTQMATAATLVGLETPAQSINLDVKPYAVASLTTDTTAATPFTNRTDPDVGFDVKYGLTRSLTADLTVNTDFAQVEEDLQQINLTRFNLLFPEKREFFLEGQGIFEFGGQAGQQGGSSDVPIMFFSRRIGLSAGQAVPVLAGGRVTGKAGRFDIGALAIRTDDKPSARAVATSYSAVRIRRDILRRSNIGLIATGRFPAAAGADTAGTFGIDADLRFYDNVQALMYWAASSGPDGNGRSARGRFAYSGDRYGLQLEHLRVGDGFNPEVGFMRRADFASSAIYGRFSPRLRRSRLVRRLTWESEIEYVTDARRTRLEDRNLFGGFGIEFNSSDQIDVRANRHYELLPLAFEVSRGIAVPAGSYATESVSASYTLGQQRPLSGTVSASRSSFYGGTRTAASYNGRFGFSPHLAIEPNVSLNWVSLPFGDFTARLMGSRLVVTPTPRLGFSTLVQYNTSARSLTSSARMRWEYVPGSELFVVYSDGRDTSVRGFPGLVNRSLAVKVTRLLRF